MPVIVKCNYCGEDKKKCPSQVRKRNFCNKKCESEFNKGTNNPNFGNRWSNEQKHEQSEKILKRYEENPDLKWIVGSANRGKIFDEERRKNISEGHKGKCPHNFKPETREKIGIKSKEKFTKEYKKQFRKTMEDMGYWLPLDEKTNWNIYFEKSNWIENMIEYASNDEKKLLNEHKFFNCRTNPKGIVRDHCYSRKSGFENKVYPQLLRHPCNCNFITHYKLCRAILL